MMNVEDEDSNKGGAAPIPPLPALDDTSPSNKALFGGLGGYNSVAYLLKRHFPTDPNADPQILATAACVLAHHCNLSPEWRYVGDHLFAQYVSRATLPLLI